jgi:uncharacterized Tic20 family protein
MKMIILSLVFTTLFSFAESNTSIEDNLLSDIHLLTQSIEDTELNMIEDNTQVLFQKLLEYQKLHSEKDVLYYQAKERTSFRNTQISIILILSVTVVLLIWIMLNYLKVDIHNEHIIRFLAIIIILFIMAFIVLVITDPSQLSAVIGLLGAIAGYFLKEGRDSIKERKSDNEIVDKS